MLAVGGAASIAYERSENLMVSILGYTMFNAVALLSSYYVVQLAAAGSA